MARYQLRAAVRVPVASHRAMTASASGWWHQARKLAQPSADEPPLGHPRELEEEHVPGQRHLLDPRRPERGRVADRQRDEVVDPVGQERGEGPGQGGAPVVADDMGAPDPELVENGHQVPGREQDVVRLHPSGGVRGPEAARGRARCTGSRRRPGRAPGGARGPPSRGTRGGGARAAPPPPPRRGSAPRCCRCPSVRPPSSSCVRPLPGVGSRLVPVPELYRPAPPPPGGPGDPGPSALVAGREVQGDAAGRRRPGPASGHRVVIDLSRVLNRTPSMPWMWASPNSDCFHPPNE